MYRKAIWIEITQDWLAFGIVARGRVTGVHRVLIDHEGETRSARRDRPGFPPNLQHHITHALSMLGASRAGVNVLWHASGPCSDLRFVEAAPVPAIAIGLRAFFEANALDPQSWATSAHIVATGAHVAAVLISAIHADALREIAEGVVGARCGLRTIIPAPSAGLLLASEEAIGASRLRRGPIICLHVGEWATAIAIGADGELLLARTVDVGVAILRHAHLRAIRAEHDSYPAAFLAADKRLLETDGIPSPQDADVIASIESARPFLQRLFIEIKATVRFTLGEDELESARVHLTGRGASIPFLRTTLAKEIGFESVETPSMCHAASAPGFGIADAVRADAEMLGIRPRGRVTRQERATRRAG